MASVAVKRDVVAETGGQRQVVPSPRSEVSTSPS